MYITTEVEVDVDIDDVIAHMSPEEQEQLAKELSKNPPLTDESELWRQMRLAASSGNITELLSLVEAIGWNHHDVFVDTSRISRAAS